MSPQPRRLPCSITAQIHTAACGNGLIPPPGILTGLLLCLLFLFFTLPARAQSLTTGIDQCDNLASSSTQVSRYDPASGKLELPLVFVPGSGWYQAELQKTASDTYSFALSSLTPSCASISAPAAFFSGLSTVYIPELAVTGNSEKYDVRLIYAPATGLFTPTEIWNAETTQLTAVAAQARSHRQDDGAFAALVDAVQLGTPLGTNPANAVIALSRISGGHIANADSGCSGRHLHSGPISIDGSGAYADPNPTGCGFGLIISVEEEALGPGTFNVSIPTGANYCGPDITSVFFSRLKIMSQRLAALPSSEHGVFDGTLFLARNGTNMDFATGNIRDTQGNSVCPTQNCSGTGHTSTFTLCGQCMISHIDNDIEYGFVANSLGVPWSVQLAGAHSWDLLQRGSLDPLPSQLAYRIGNDLASAIRANPNASDTSLCATLAASRLRTGVNTYQSAAAMFASELSGFGKGSCVPCPYGCPEALIIKDFSTQSWDLDNGQKATYP